MDIPHSIYILVVYSRIGLRVSSGVDVPRQYSVAYYVNGRNEDCSTLNSSVIATDIWHCVPVNTSPFE